VEFLGPKQLATEYGLRCFELELYDRITKGIGRKTENFAIITDSQWLPELPELLVEDTNSELKTKRVTN